ncbi:MAG: hypothetical protein JWO08_3386 [Verrucomicrobiaceae bacterium]|nr:hypothetical protein [Verrucomicrobiaceae bacterium]
MILNGPPLSEEEVAAFEQRHKVTLPEDYRNFMLAWNGGMPNPELFGFGVAVTEFWSISKERGNLDQMCESLDWPEAHAEGTPVIGRDVCGSEFLLATRGDKCGTVYFLDREETLRPSTGHVEIAPSFSHLMSHLVSE